MGAAHLELGGAGPHRSRRQVVGPGARGKWLMLLVCCASIELALRRAPRLATSLRMVDRFTPAVGFGFSGGLLPRK